MHWLSSVSHSLLLFWFHLLQDWGYLGVIVLMAMESSIFPVPSEVVIPPAVYWAATEGKMSFWGVVLAGTVGSYLGSAITYWISSKIGRQVILKFGRYFFITEEKLERAEHFVHRYEAGGIFFARLLPVVRHLISIPAGIVRMNFAVFSATTIVGSAIWCTVLAWLGDKITRNNPGLIQDPEALIHAIKHDSLWIIGAIVIFGALYFLTMKLTAKKQPVTQA